MATINTLPAELYKQSICLVFDFLPASVMNGVMQGSRKWILKRERQRYNTLVCTQARLLECDLHADITFYLPTKRKRDVQNLVSDCKPLFDALQGKIYVDDAQIISLLASKEYRKNEPGIKLVFSEIDSTEKA